MKSSGSVRLYCPSASGVTLPLILRIFRAFQANTMIARAAAQDSEATKLAVPCSKGTLAVLSPKMTCGAREVLVWVWLERVEL